MQNTSQAAHAVINRRAEQRLLQGHPWIYKSDIIQRPAGGAGLVRVCNEKRRMLGTAFFSPASTITLRLVQRGAQVFDRSILRARLVAAQARRARLMPGADAYRWVHGEADFLPGIFIDRYGDCVALQTTCAAADVWLPDLQALIMELAAPRALVLRNDASTRSREKLPQERRVLHGPETVHAVYHEGDLALQVDLMGDQKTGGFLDQAINHVQAARYAQGRALDCFTYHGGFAMQMAARGCEVTAYDLSEPALAQARGNAARAGVQVDFTQGNVFEVLPALHAQKAQFDTLVLDPPAFASTAKTEEAAGRAYKEINLRAMKLLAPNSVLVTCSCSGRITPQDFDAILQAAGRDIHRSVHIVQRWSAGPDHPVLAGVPETDYLKCRVLMVV